MAEHIFKRKAYQKMLQWKRESNGETALLIEGARRVGKSTIVRQFAKNEYKSFALFDFAKASKDEKALFDDLSDMDFFFNRLRLLKGITLYERNTVIIFDEVQKYPVARQAIKSLVEDGRYDYIETGSLISIHKNVENIIIPSEEETITLHPMDYEEFLWALGDESSTDLFREAWQKKRGFGDAVNRKLMRDLRLYMLVGGMPQAVSKYIDTKDLAAVDKVKRAIIRLYLNDFQKIDKTGKAMALFMAIPSQLSGNANRFQPSSAIDRTRNEQIDNLIFLMNDSKTVNVCYHANDPNVGLDLTTNRSAYKLFLADTGLFVTLAFWDKDFTDNIIYSKLLNDSLSVNLGYVYENLVAQMLVASGNRLFYYTFPDGNKHNYEVDFLLSRGAKICPIEVKSEGYNLHRSIDEFCIKYSSRVCDRYLVYTKDLRRDKETIMLPIYMLSVA
ncbi:MAG: ATP-binding protein [Bacteroidales bacterium]|nr:ATP-binding protein [Bacteroidales bacterium]